MRYTFDELITAMSKQQVGRFMNKNYKLISSLVSVLFFNISLDIKPETMQKKHFGLFP